MHTKTTKQSKPLIIAREISLLIDEHSILPSVSVSIQRERIGLVGDNGVGKSTLLKVLTGRVTPSTGSIARSCRLAYLPQDYTFDTSITISDLLQKPHDGFNEGTARSYLARFGFTDFDLAQGLESLSGGERMKVHFATLLATSPELIILDEPTNNLDLHAREFLYSFIKKWNKGLLVVSHDRELLNLMDRILELTPRGITEYGGNYEIYMQQKEGRQQALNRRLTTAKEELDKTTRKKQVTLEQQQQMKKSSRKRSYKTGMPKQMRGHRQRKGEESTGRLKNVHEVKVEEVSAKVAKLEDEKVEEKKIKLELPDTQVPNGKLMIKMSDVSFSYQKSSQQVVSNLDLSIYGPERLAIAGANGSGKTTLVRLITKELAPTSGMIEVGSDRIAYLDQSTSILHPNKTLFEQCKVKYSDYSDSQIRRWLGRFLFSNDEVFKKTSVLSGGERMKAALALVLGGKHPPQILILDEPTNNLDLSSITQLESALSNYKGVLIVISHVFRFLSSIGVKKFLQLPS